MPTYYLLMILGQVIVVAAAAAVLFFLSFNNAKQDTSGTPRSASADAKRVSDLFAEVGSVLAFHGRALLGVSRASDADGEDDSALQHAANLATLRHCNRETHRSLQGHNAQLDELMSHYGDLYDAERRDLDAYAAKTDQLNRALGAAAGQSAQYDPALLQMVSDMQNENEQLRQRVAECQREAAELVAQAVRSNREARLDTLTRLPNRRAWEEQWQSGATAGSSYLAMVDIDQFKQINDQYGHRAGDAILTLLGTLIGELHDVSAFRIGGDEFGLLLQKASPEQAHQSVENLRARIQRSTVRYQGESLGVTASFGVALVGEGDWQQTAIERADQALYAAKNAGGNRTHFCLDDPEPSVARLSES